jgi:hypothetical protein
MEHLKTGLEVRIDAAIDALRNLQEYCNDKGLDFHGGQKGLDALTSAEGYGGAHIAEVQQLKAQC